MNVSKVNVLCMMAHPDDAEIICGGSLIKLIDQGYKVAIVDFSSNKRKSQVLVDKRI